MNNDYLIFNFSHKKQNKIYFGKNFEESPYIDNNKLYFPKKIILKHLGNSTLIENEDNKKLIPQKENKDYREKEILAILNTKEPKGLPNIGGICYMNALLQCFYYCWPMTFYFLNLDEESKERLGTISRGYYNFVNDLYSGNYNPALKFKDAIMKIDKSFIGNEGKDSKDLAILTLSEINQDLKPNINSVIYSDKVESNLYDKLSVYKEKLELDKINNNSNIISKTFFYDILYEQQCESSFKCEYYKTSYDVQTDNIIIFEIEKIYNNIRKGYSSKPSLTIQDCLESYSKEEIIVCPFCSIKTLKMKKYICSLPEIFVFVMSRGRNAKFKCKINFTKEIDMNNFYYPIDNSYRTYDTKYELIGATLAIDWSKGFGHTIAFCKTYKNNDYYIFNDSRAWKVDFSKIKDDIPYILFYQKKK